jgi:hypothetical protein
MPSGQRSKRGVVFYNASLRTVKSKCYFYLFTFTVFLGPHLLLASTLTGHGQMVPGHPVVSLFRNARPISCFMLLSDETSTASAGASGILRGHSSSLHGGRMSTWRPGQPSTLERWEALSQQGNKSCYCLLVLCPARSATAYLVPLSPRHFRVFFLLLGNSNVSLFGLAEFTAPQRVDIFGNRM